MPAFTKVLAYARRSRTHARHFVTCPSTHPTSTPSRCPSANSKHFCAEPPNERFPVSDEPFAPSCHVSVLENVPTTSGMRGILQYDRETLLEHIPIRLTCISASVHRNVL